MTIEISIDDGHPLDLKVFGLLQKYNIAHLATFYIPINPQLPRMTDNEIRMISQYSRIGGHTISHRVLTKLSPEEQAFEIKEGNNILSRIIDKEVTRFSPPRGWTNSEVEQVAEECGVEYYRLMKQGVTELELATDGYMNIVPITVHTHPNHIGNWKRRWVEAKKKGYHGYFHVTMHGWEIDKFGYWENLEEIFKKISKEVSS